MSNNYFDQLSHNKNDQQNKDFEETQKVEFLGLKRVNSFNDCQKLLNDTDIPVKQKRKPSRKPGQGYSIFREKNQNLKENEVKELCLN